MQSKLSQKDELTDQAITLNSGIVVDIKKTANISVSASNNDGKESKHRANKHRIQNLRYDKPLV